MRLRFVARLAPPVSGFGAEAVGDEISFLSLDRIWADDRFDPSQTIEYTGDIGSYNAVNEGDILLPKVSPTFAHGRCAIANGLIGRRALATSEVFVLRANEPVDARFLKYRLLAPDFLDTGQGAWLGVAGLKRVPSEFVKNVWIGDEVWAQRHTIAEFLDRECERLTGASRAAERIAELVKRRAFEHQIALLDKDVITSSMPRIRWVADVLSGFAFPSNSFRHDDTGVRLLRGINVGVGEIRWDDLVCWDSADVAPYAKWELRNGDLVMGMDRPWISSGTRVATLSEHDVPSLLLQRVACLRPRAGLLTAYLKCWLQHPRFRAELGSATTGVSVPHVSSEQIGAFRIALPDPARQSEVVREANRAGDASKDAERASFAVRARLVNYRDSLIHEAVTGKLDVASVSEQQMEERLHAASEGRLDEVGV